MAEKSKYQDIDAVDAALDKGVAANDAIGDSTTGLTKQVTELERKVSGKKTVTNTFEVSKSSHSSTEDKIAVSISSGQTFKVKISLGTAQFGGQLQVYWSNDESSEHKTISIDEEYEITPSFDVAYISFYINGITTYGTFNVVISYDTEDCLSKKIDSIGERVGSEDLNTDEKNLSGAVNEIKGNLDEISHKISGALIESSFEVSKASHSSNDDKIAVSISSGQTFKVKISLGTAQFDGNKLQVYWSNDESSEHKTISIDEEYEITPSFDVAYISFYIYMITTYGTFNVVISYDMEDCIDERLSEIGEQIDDINNGVECTKNRLNQSTLIQYGGTNATKNLVLLHFSDIHSDSTALGRIVAFKNKYGSYLTDAVCTGDLVFENMDEDDATNRGFAYWGNAGASSIMIALGNHDYKLSAGVYTDAATAYAKFIEPYISNWGVVVGGESVNYYYKDYDNCKVRLVVLDWGNQDETQLSWFTSTLASAKNSGYAVIIAEHCPFEWEKHTKLKNRFDALIPFQSNKQILSEDYASAVDDFISGDGEYGEFVCWLTGHTHKDYFSTLEGHNNQVVVSVAAACTIQSPKENDIYRVVGTPSQDLFNIVTVDTNLKVFTLLRIGADCDRIQRPRKHLCWDYVNHVLIDE